MLRPAGLADGSCDQTDVWSWFGACTCIIVGSNKIPCRQRCRLMDHLAWPGQARPGGRLPKNTLIHTVGSDLLRPQCQIIPGVLPVVTTGPHYPRSLGPVSARKRDMTDQAAALAGSFHLYLTKEKKRKRKKKVSRTQSKSSTITTAIIPDSLRQGREAILGS